MKVFIRLVNLFLATALVVAQSGRAYSQHTDQTTSLAYGSPAIVQTIPPLGSSGPGLSYVQTFGETQVPYYDEPGHLNFPRGVAVDGDRVWIAEYIGKRTLLYNADGSFVKKIGRAMMYLPFVLAEIPYECDVAVTPDHNLWLNFQGDLVKVDPDGNFLGYTSGGPDSSYGCKGLAVDEAGQLFVSDKNNHTITVFDSSGSHIQTIGGVAGNGELQFNRPENIAVKDGVLYVAENYNHRVQLVNVSDLNNVTFIAFIDEYLAGGSLDTFNQPGGVGVDATRIFVADTLNHRVQVFDLSTREYLLTLGDGGQGPANNQWNNPFDIAVDASGRIYITDINNHRVQQFDSSLTLQRTFGETGVPYLTDGKHFMFPESIQADQQGNIYISESRAHRVVKIEPDGTPIFSLGGIGVVSDDLLHFNTPIGLAVDALNQLYVADSGNHRIQVFDQYGNYLDTFGSYGDGQDQFDTPSGIAINPNTGDIIVADTNNCRFQVFDSIWNYITTIGQTDVCGSDHEHFNQPYDVVVDHNNNIYLTDNIERLEKCTLSGTVPTCVTLVGEPGVKGEPFFNFQYIQGVGVDANGLVYVIDHGLSVVYIYDSQGRFYGSLGGVLLPKDITIDALGNAYVTDAMNQRIQKFSHLDLDWKQINIDHFGDSHLANNPALAAYDNHLYAGYWHSDGAQVWRMDTTGAWQKVAAVGIDDPLNRYISSMLPYMGNLYVGTENPQDTLDELTGGAIYRYDGTAWEKVASGGLGEPTNAAFISLAEFKDYLYAGTLRRVSNAEPYPVLGAHIWRSPSGDVDTWEKVLDFSAINPGSKNEMVRDMVVYNDTLYAAVLNEELGAEIWRSSDGLLWEPVVTGGFGHDYLRIDDLEVFDNMLYAGAGRRGAKIWRCQTCASQDDFELVVQGGFNLQDNDNDGRLDNEHITGLRSFRGYLYAWTYNAAGGSETWRSRNGLSWEHLGERGLGVFADSASYPVISHAEFNNTLFAGTDSTAIWRLDPRVEVFKTGTGSGSVTSDTPGIDCGAACSAEFNSSATITLTATATPGSSFTGWSGEGCSGTSECAVLVDHWRTVSANFDALPEARLLTVNLQGDGAGLVTSAPAGINCGSQCQYAFNLGTAVQLTAQASLGSFTGWSGDCSGIGICYLTLSENRSVSATFATHAPVVTSFEKAGVANTNLGFVPADFSSHFNDEDGDTLVHVSFASLPVYGDLLWGERTVNLVTIIPYESLDQLVYQPEVAYTGSDSFTWTGSDGLYDATPPAIVTLFISPDSDGDASGDDVEATTPPLLPGGLLGDGNGDGLLDATQTNVSSQLALNSSLGFPTASEPGISITHAQSDAISYTTLETDASLSLYQVLPVPYPAGNPPAPENAAGYPFGFLPYQVKNLLPGSAVDIILYVDGSTAPDQFLFYGATSDDVNFHLVDFSYDGQTGVQVVLLPNNKLKITLHYVDGLKGDSDLTANGFIQTCIGAVDFWKHVYLPLARR